MHTCATWYARWVTHTHHQRGGKWVPKQSKKGEKGAYMAKRVILAVLSKRGVPGPKQRFCVYVRGVSLVKQGVYLGSCRGGHPACTPEPGYPQKGHFEHI